MKRLLMFSLLVASVSHFARAQEQLSLKQQAAQLFDRYEYYQSLRLYLKLADRKNPGTPVLERVADCFFNMNLPAKAEDWYARAVADTAATALSHYRYAETLLYGGKFEAARQQYQQYFKKIPDAVMLARKLSSCDSAAAWTKQTPRYAVTNLPVINSDFAEFGLVENGKDGFIFTSNRRADYNKTDNRTGNNWFRLFKADAKGDNISEIYLGNGVDNLTPDNFHIGPAAFTAQGYTAYITLTTDVEKRDIKTDKQTDRYAPKLYTRRLQLVVAVKKYNNWVVVANFGYNNINEYSVGHAALSRNGQIMYFTSDMPGGEGKTDIWYCEKQADGSWGKPANCGKTINTPEEEAFPEVSGDDRLYYSSKGLPGMGGYDIFVTEGSKTRWNTPVNLKWPINSTGDDFCLVTRNGLSGYLSSNRAGGQGDDDIYRFSETGPPIKIPVAATAKAVKPVVQPADKPKQENNIGDFAVGNIYYDLDKYNIRPDAAAELDKLIVLMKQHPEFKLSIASHTDTRASGEYNIALSQRRSASVISYLQKRGINPARISSAAYGKTRLLNDCTDGVPCTADQHQLNRRTEFRIIR